MNVPLFKALVALLPVSLLLSGSVIMWLRGKTPYQLMQLLGAGCLVVVVLTHICEALHLLPGMHWGLQHSAGHYVDLVAAVLGVALFSGGYLLQAAYQPNEGHSLTKNPD
jgi:hypothetical protein